MQTKAFMKKPLLKKGQNNIREKKKLFSAKRRCIKSFLIFMRNFCCYKNIILFKKVPWKKTS